VILSPQERASDGAADEAARARDQGLHACASPAAKETNPTVHGAAMLAQIRPGAGRRAVIALEVYLRDPAPDLRAAAAAGVVRAGGDANLADLYVLFKENDARPALAALQELRKLHTDESSVSTTARKPIQGVRASVAARAAG